MNFVDRTARSQSESIAFEFDLDHAPEKVWRALTDPELLAEWLLPVFDLKLEPGIERTVELQAGDRIAFAMGLDDHGPAVVVDADRSVRRLRDAEKWWRGRRLRQLQRASSPTMEWRTLLGECRRWTKHRAGRPRWNAGVGVLVNDRPTFAIRWLIVGATAY
jgi:uncharacterized protein YndB with AHSA1/START domain